MHLAEFLNTGGGVFSPTPKPQFHRAPADGLALLIASDNILRAAFPGHSLQCLIRGVVPWGQHQEAVDQILAET